jgi:hypothetical protein
MAESFLTDVSLSQRAHPAQKFQSAVTCPRDSCPFGISIRRQIDWGEWRRL